MKYFWLVCAGMADEPLAALEGRTPLEVAKTPFMDELAKNATLANAAWVEPSLPASDEVAALSMLGYNPKESYTGLAPLEALAAGFTQNDAQIMFRCDFVTLVDGELSDHTAGKISAKEAQVLAMELNRGLADFKAKIIPVDGYRNLLVIDDADKSTSLDELETTSPVRVRGEQIAKWPLKGKAAGLLQEITAFTRKALENHDVNRVRIDLGENPASQVWLWGQGRRPKLQPFQQRTGARGAFFAERLGWRGLGLAAGLHPMKKWDENEFADFTLLESSAKFNETSTDYKAKIRRIEEFDTQVVGKIVTWLGKKKTPARIVITSDVVHSTVRGANTHGHAPLLVWGEGFASSGADGFNEKTCGLSGRLFDPGHTFIAQFLKG